MTALQPSFPALEPASRTWVGGQPGQDIFTAASGIETRIMFGAQAYGQVLTLSYANISEDDARLFDTHYAFTRGSFTAFVLPKETYAGMQVPFFPQNTMWRYSGAPEIVSVQPDVHSVNVTLICVDS